MKRKLLKTFAVAALAVFSLAISEQIWVSAQDTNKAESAQQQFSAGKGARSIEGTWDVIVTIRNCQTGNPITAFKAMDMFIRGGSVIDTNAAPPSTRGPGFGTWEHLSERNFTSTIRFFMYNPDGSFAGTRRLTQNIELNETADEWASTVKLINFDPAGNQVSTGCSTAAGTRAE